LTTDDGADCPVCGGLRFVTHNVPVGHPDFGRAFPCVCQLESIRARREAQLREASNLDIVADKTFDTFETDLHYLDASQLSILRSAIDRARRYAENPAGWLLFQGNYGCGKTHLAVAIANHQLDQGQPVLFMTVPDLLDHLRATFGPTSEVRYDELFDRVRNTPLLVLDDVGVESATPWAQEKLYQLLNHRYLHRLATVVTTNVDLNTLDPRVRSRLVDRNLTQIVNMPLPDYRRMDRAQEQTELSSLHLYQDMVFETFETREGRLPQQEVRNLQQALEAALEYARDPRDWLVFIGEHGCGKTHLAAAIANYRRKIGEDAILVSAPDLLDYLREAFNPAAGITFSKRFQEIRAARLLVIDQLDLSNASPWALEKMRQIANHRYLARLATVFTTDLELERQDPMLRSRLLDRRRCRVFAILAPDYRGGEPPPARRPPAPYPRR